MTGDSVSQGEYHLVKLLKRYHDFSLNAKGGSGDMHIMWATWGFYPNPFDFLGSKSINCTC